MKLPAVRQVWVIGRISMLPQALAFICAFLIVAWGWAGSVDLSSIIETTKSLAPAFVIVGLGAVFVVSITVVARQESLDRTSARSRAAASRLVAPLLTPMAVVLLAVAICRLTESGWHQGPLIAGGLNLASVTMVLNCIVTPAWASLTGSIYVLICFFSANSQNWWNFLMRESGASEVLLSAAIFGGASIFYSVTGARAAHVYDD